MEKSTKSEFVSQTDILKDTIHIEKVKEIKKKNEKVDRRLARLGNWVDFHFLERCSTVLTNGTPYMIRGISYLDLYACIVFD